MFIELMLAVLAGSLLQGLALVIACYASRRDEPEGDALDAPATRRDLAELDLRCAEQADAAKIAARRECADVEAAARERWRAAGAEQFRIIDDAQRRDEAIHARVNATNSDLGRISDDVVSIRARATATDEETGRAFLYRDRAAASEREKRRAIEDEVARLRESADLLNAATFAALPDWRCAWRDCGEVATCWAWRRDAKGARRVEARCLAHERGDAFTVPFFDPAYAFVPNPVAMASWVGFTGAENAATTGDLTQAVLAESIRRFNAIKRGAKP